MSCCVKRIPSICKITAAWNARCADWKTRYPVVTDEHRKPEGEVSVFNLAEVIGTEVGVADKLVVGNSGSAIEIYLLACPTYIRSAFITQRAWEPWVMRFQWQLRLRLLIPVGTSLPSMAMGDSCSTSRNWRPSAGSSLPIKFFVLNNDGYASIRASQKSLFWRIQDRRRQQQWCHDTLI